MLTRIKKISEKAYYGKYWRIVKELKKDHVVLPWRSCYGGIRQRCVNENSTGYEYYGGRGIKCRITPKELMDLYFRDKAYRMKKPSIDRIDSDGHYEFKNLHWVELADNVRKSVDERVERNKIRALESQN